jgi:hypothetical protein
MLKTIIIYIFAARSYLLVSWPELLSLDAIPLLELAVVGLLS